MIRTRVLPLAIALLLAGSLSCTTVANLLGTGGQAGTAPGAGEIAAPGEPGIEPTSDVRRLELPPTPTPFHVTDEDDPRAILDLGDPDYTDSFDDPVKWFNDDSPGRAAYQVEDGRLWGMDYEPEEINSWWSWTDKQSDLVYAEVSATNGDCIGKDAVGFLIHADTALAAGGYSLEVSCDGSWRFLSHRLNNKRPEEVVEWTPSDVIQTGEGATNRLGIWDHFGTFYFFINGVMVGEARDSQNRHPGGMFALYVKASQTYNLEAWFDDLAVWQLPYTL